MLTHKKFVNFIERTQRKILWLIVSIDVFKFLFIKHGLSKSVFVLVQGKMYEVYTFVSPLNFSHQFHILCSVHLGH